MESYLRLINMANKDKVLKRFSKILNVSRLIINDISAPLRQVCKEPKKNDYVPSLNVYWEYGYAAGLSKTQIVICEENQFDKIPFDGGSKQILKYNTYNLEHVLNH